MIEVYKGTVTKEYCEEAIKVFEDLDNLKLTDDRKLEADEMFKSDSSVCLTEIPIHATRDTVYVPLKKIIDEKLEEYANKYSVLRNGRKLNCYSMKIQRTKPTEGYHIWHCENAGMETASRVLAWTLYLNDTYEAGETEFLYQSVRYKAEQGDFMIFPASFTHAHRGNPPINGVKYIITGWYEY